MHIGKCWRASSSTISARIPSPAFSLVLHSEPIPATKPCERLARIGSSRVSSSIRGSAFAVIYCPSGSASYLTLRVCDATEWCPYLQSTLQASLELLEHNARLLPAGNVSPAISEKNPPLLDKVGNASPLDLRHARYNCGRTKSKNQRTHFKELFFLVRVLDDCFELRFVHRLLALIYL